MIIRITSPDLPRELSKLTILATQISIRAKTSTKRIAEQVLKDSDTIPPMVPVDTERLRESGRVEPTPQGHAVVYGGQTVRGIHVDYAEKVHDDMRARRYKREGSGPKFVETHVLRRAEEAPNIYAYDIQELADSIWSK